MEIHLLDITCDVRIRFLRRVRDKTRSLGENQFNSVLLLLDCSVLMQLICSRPTLRTIVHKWFHVKNRTSKQLSHRAYFECMVSEIWKKKRRKNYQTRFAACHRNHTRSQATVKSEHRYQGIVTTTSVLVSLLITLNRAKFMETTISTEQHPLSPEFRRRSTLVDSNEVRRNEITRA